MKLLVAYSRNSTQVTTTYEYLTAFRKHWPGEVAYLHVTNDAILESDLDNYDVLLHNYCARLCFEGYVSESYKSAVRAFKGLKVLSVQDEYDRTDVLKQAIKDLGFDVVLTCMPEDQRHLVYPGHEFEGVEFLTVLTGYIDDNESESPPRVRLSDRPNVVGYRGRNIGVRYGQLGFDKYEIGRWVKAYCEAHGIKHDIAMEDADRIYGPKWSEFIRSCRTMLGSESGSNVFDFKGSIEKKLQGIDFKSSESQRVLSELVSIEEKFDVGQISPRVFECVQNYTPMILYEGRYSDAIEPYQHYLPLKKDHSNIEEVFSAVDRVDELEKMATRAYEHLVASDRYSYRSFVERISEVARSKKLRVVCDERSLVSSWPGEGCSHLEYLPNQKPTSLPKVGPTADIEGPFETLSRIYLPALAKNFADWKRTTALAKSHGGLTRLTWERDRLRQKVVLFALLAKKVIDLLKAQLGLGLVDEESAIMAFVYARKRFRNAKQLRKGYADQAEFLNSNEIALAEFQKEVLAIEMFVEELKSKTEITKNDLERIKSISKRCPDLVRRSNIRNDAVLL